MAGDWFYLDRGTEKGPFSDDQLRAFVGQGTISPWTPVKRVVEGGDQSPWRRAGEVRGLFAGDVSARLGGGICAECGQLRLPDGRCGKCVPPAPLPRTPKTSSKADGNPTNGDRQLSGKERPWNDAKIERALSIVGAAMILSVIVIELGRWGLSDRARFQSQNAYGATANAVEAMRFSLNLWFGLFAGIACILFAKFSEIARHLRTIAAGQNSHS